MGRFVIVAYTPKTGKEQQLLAAVQKHLKVLQAEQLVTESLLTSCGLRTAPS